MIDCKLVPRAKDGMNKGLEDQPFGKRVIYTLEIDGKSYLVENVPARADEKTGEQLFAPSVVERLQEAFLGRSDWREFAETHSCKYSE